MTITRVDVVIVWVCHTASKGYTRNHLAEKRKEGHGNIPCSFFLNYLTAFRIKPCRTKYGL